MLFLFVCLVVLGIVALYFASKTPKNFGYKGLAYKALGKKVWQFSNRLVGIFLIVIGVLGGIAYQVLGQPEDRSFFWGSLLVILCSFLVSDLITIQKFKQK